MINILFFGRLSDFAQPVSCELPNSVKNTQQLCAWLEDNNSGLAGVLSDKSIRIALNQAFVTGNADIQDGDEVAFMSPLSGG